MIENNCVKRDEKTASRIIDGQAVIMTLGDNTLHTLNGVGSRIWELCDGEKTLRDIADVIHEEYMIDYENALADCETFVQVMKSKGMLFI